MSEHYHDVADLRLLKEMGKLAPTEFNAWLNLDKIVGREDGAIPESIASSSHWESRSQPNAPTASKCTPRPRKRRELLAEKSPKAR